VKEANKPFNLRRAIFFLMIFICGIIAGGVLKITAAVILPFTISLLLAISMYPLVKLTGELHFHRNLAILLITFIIIAGIYGLGMVLFSSGRMIVSLYPKYEKRLTEIYVWVSGFLGLSYNEDLTFFENLWAQLNIRTWVRNFTFTFSNFFITFLKNAFLMMIFFVFLLIEASHIKEKLNTAFASRSESINRIVYDIVKQVSRYLAAKFFISLVTGIITSFALMLIGVEFALIWGVLQFVLNFIPVIGSIFVGFGASLFALIQFWPNPVPVVLVIVILLVINMVIGNIMDPKIIGDHVGISPIVVLLSLLLWGWIWGFAGMVVAVPMMVIIKIICENIPFLEPISILLGSKKAIKAQQS
jgi:predicted PurR-regulated permease PerM